MAIAAVAFDLDGVLIDSEPTWADVRGSLDELTDGVVQPATAT